MSLVVPVIADFDGAAVVAALAHQRQLTKPAGSLGRLEELATWYAGVRGGFPVAVPGRAELFVFAADHGVVTEGVSAYPSEVTGAMVANFRNGGAAVNVLARQCGVEVTVVDVGVGVGVGASVEVVTSEVTPVRYVEAVVRRGTRNLRHQAALSRAEAEQAIAVGARMAAEGVERGADILVGGEMGIGNTTAAAALLCAFTGDDPADVVGRGTGIDDAACVRKAAVIREGLATQKLDPRDPLGVLAGVGGLEIAALAGLMLGGAAARRPVIVDGFIAGAAALVATRLAPGARPFLLLSHLSAERGARRMCGLLGGAPPLLEFDMRLGEGTGAVLVVPLLRAAVALQSQMATFASAAVPQRS